MRLLRYFIGLTLFTIPTILIAAPASTSTDYGIIIQRFKQATSTFSDIIMPSALVLFGLLAAIDIAMWSLKQLPIEDLGKYLMKLARRVGYYAFLMALIKTDMLLEIVMGFVKLGEKGAGFQGFKPTDMMVDGLNIIASITNKTSAWDIATNPLAAFVLGACIILMLATFGILVAQYIFVWIQLYIYMALNPVLISLGALTYTKDIAQKVISTVIVIGTRFMTIYLVVAIARNTVPDMSADIARSTLDNMGPLYSAVGMAIVLLFLAIKSPTIATDILNGTSSLSAGDAASMPFVAAAAGAIAGAAITEIQKFGTSFGGEQSSSSSGSNGTMPLSEAAGVGVGGSGPASASGMSGMGSGAYSSPGGAVSDLNPSWFSDPAGSASSGAGMTNAVGSNSVSGGEQASSGGSISSANSSVEQLASAAPSSLADQTSSGGSIGGADTTSQPSQPNSAVADHVSRGLQEFAQAEKSTGASVNIQFGHEEI
jgi:type IV secretion system protein TrbL